MASFRNVYTSLLLVIAGSTDRELARQVNYLKAENQILRSRLPGRISLTEREKNRLIRFAKNLGSALNELATIVHPGTIRRWIREAAAKSKARRKGKSGRPRTAMDIEKLILQTGQRQFLGLHQDPRRTKETWDRIGNAQHSQKHSQTQWLRVRP